MRSLHMQLEQEENHSDRYNIILEGAFGLLFDGTRSFGDGSFEEGHGYYEHDQREY